MTGFTESETGFTIYPKPDSYNGIPPKGRGRWYGVLERRRGS